MVYPVSLSLLDRLLRVLVYATLLLSTDGVTALKTSLIRWHLGLQQRRVKCHHTHESSEVMHQFIGLTLDS
jgi:hypothetical protein